MMISDNIGPLSISDKTRRLAHAFWTSFRLLVRECTERGVTVLARSDEQYTWCSLSTTTVDLERWSIILMFGWHWGRFQVSVEVGV